MKLGLTLFVTDRSISITRLAREAEAAGFHSLFIPEKTHVPTSRATPWAGGDLPDRYLRSYDPFVALTAATAVTERIRIGTGICLVPLHDPILLAKKVASLDHLSGGRFVFGVGYGWNVEELEGHGIRFSDRHELLEEKLAAMRALWGASEHGFEGRLVKIEPCWAWPKPVPDSGPPVLVGSRYTPQAFAGIARYADGWLPIEGFGQPLRHIPRLRDAFERAGRDPATAVVSIYSFYGDETALEAYREHGVSEVLLSLPASGTDDALSALEGYAALLQQLEAAPSAWSAR